jgi:hypothetical protein
MDNPNPVPTAAPAPGAELRQLAHKLRNHLFTISLGMKSLEMIREDSARFNKLLERIRTEALGGLEEVANELDNLSQRIP